jgi:RNA 2',3'-cyclic 3'-phosphodiesterase
MSLFVAIRPSAAAVDHLDRSLAGLRSQAELRWLPIENVHLTLAFLGLVPDEHRPDLEKRLTRAAARHRPMTLGLAGAGSFGSRVLFAKVGGEVEALGHLAASVAAAARRAKVPVDERPYRPHLTLARSRDETSLRPFAEELDEYAGPVWTAVEVLLMESRSAGVPGRAPAYVVRGRYGLAGGLA